MRILAWTVIQYGRTGRTADPDEGKAAETENPAPRGTLPRFWNRPGRDAEFPAAGEGSWSR